MMYNNGDLKVVRPPETVFDSRCDWEDRSSVAYLPHSCDQWIIGGREQIEDMLSDLQDALNILDVIEEKQSLDERKEG